MVSIGENLILIGQVGTATIHQIQAGQMTFFCDLLRAQMLFHAHWVIGSRLHRGIVANDHTVPTVHLTNARDQPGRWRIAIIQPMRRGRANFQKRASIIQQIGHPRARQHFAAVQMTLPGLFAAASRCKLGCRANQF